jgi:hypothetical protein
MAHWRIEKIDKQAFLDQFKEMLRARDETLADSAEGLEGLRKVWEGRISYTEKLILLDTGTFALSLSFLGALGSHSAAKSLPYLFLPTIYSAWASLLVSILCGGVHNLLKVLALEQLFGAASALKREYRAEDHSRRFSKSASLLSGKLVPDPGEEAEEIDMGEFFSLAAKIVADEYKKTAEEARRLQTEFGAMAKRGIRAADKLNFMSLVGTVFALSLLAAAALQSAWVLLQK